MRIKSRRYLCALLLGTLYTAASELHAQPSDGDNSKLFQEVSSIPEIAAVPELKEALGNYLLGRGSFRIPKVAAGLSIPRIQQPDNTAIFESQHRLLTAATSGTIPPIIKHIKSEEGLPFPGKDQAQTLALNDDPSFQGALALNRDIMSGKDLKINLSAPELPNCKESKTFSVSLPVSEALPGDLPQTTSTTMDILYLADAPPVDAAEIFGEHTLIHRYSTKDKDFVSLFAGLIGIHCLPFRMRQTNQQIFWDMGLNALKNYSSDPNGEGEYHAYIKAKYNIE